MNLEITLVGLNHRTASVDLREKFALFDKCDPENWALPTDSLLKESFILSTCNRVELLGAGNPGIKNKMLEHWAKHSNSSVSELSRYIYSYDGPEAVRHLFEVAASLDSMILGEPQILGQMKAAYRKAADAKTTGIILNRLLHKSFSVGKRVRHETAVANSAVSISYAAVELAKKIFGTLPGHKAMLIGAGEMAELAAMHLLQGGIDSIVVTNRTYSHAQELAKRFKGNALPFEQIFNDIHKVDIVISSTGSPDPIILEKDIKKALQQRKNLPMFFIDIAVPRDIDPLINELDNVYLYDIDDLKEVIEENMASRQEEASKARQIIADEVARFWKWIQNLDMQPTILDLISRNEDIAHKELTKTLKKLGPVSEDNRKKIEKLIHSIVMKFNHAPLMYLKHAGMLKEDANTRIHTIRQVFDLDKDKDY